MQPDRRSFLTMLAAAPIAAVAPVAAVVEPVVSGGLLMPRDVARAFAAQENNRQFLVAESARAFCRPLYVIDARFDNTWSAL